MSNKITVPHLTQRNENKFFYGLEAGAIFTYSQSFLWEDVVFFAEKQGVKVAYNEYSTEEYEKFGCSSGKVIGKEEKR